MPAPESEATVDATAGRSCPGLCKPAELLPGAEYSH